MTTTRELIDRSNTIANNTDNDGWFREYAKDVRARLELAEKMAEAAKIVIGNTTNDDWVLWSNRLHNYVKAWEDLG